MIIHFPKTGVCPEGTHIFKVESVVYDDKLGRVDITLTTQDGYKHRERFCLMNKNGTQNEKAMSAFSFFAYTVMNDPNMTEVDHTALVGRYIKADVEHNKVPKDDGTFAVYSRLRSKYPATGFEREEDDAEEMSLGDLEDLLNN